MSSFMRRSSCLLPSERRGLARRPLSLLCVILRKTRFLLQPFYPLRLTSPIRPSAPPKECFSSFIAAIGDHFVTPSYGVFMNSFRPSMLSEFAFLPSPQPH